MVKRSTSRLLSLTKAPRVPWSCKPSVFRSIGVNWGGRPPFLPHQPQFDAEPWPPRRRQNANADYPYFLARASTEFTYHVARL